MEGDLGTLEGFFGRKIKLELKYRGSRDGFHYDKIKPLYKKKQTCNLSYGTTSMAQKVYATKQLKQMG